MEEDALFGLCNATTTFQILMAQALTSLTKKYRNPMICYVDDVVIVTPPLTNLTKYLSA